MLKYKADLRTLAVMFIITSLLVIQWNLDAFNPYLFGIALIMSVPVAVIAHNTNHVAMWKSEMLNILTDYWLTLFYGFPPFAWIPTHNSNHHIHNNRVPDYTITYRYSEANNLVTLLSYPSISGAFQQPALYEFLKETWKKNRKKCYYYLSQIAVLVIYIAVALLWNWKKALLYIVAPQQVSLFAVLIFNYIQHVHADEESKWDHSRNFLSGPLNFFLFNNGFHTVHHISPRQHWSESPVAHRKVQDKINPVLNEPSLFWYFFRCYILSLLIPSFGTHSLRLDRIRK
jgi:fatty acid desaturase